VATTLVAPTSSRPTSAEQAPPVAAVATDDTTEDTEQEFRSFGRAILLGIALGIPLFGALVAGGTYLADPELEPLAIAGIALWVSLFCGPFLAGTVTVGLWASRQH
jgi:hypothetical protein